MERWLFCAIIGVLLCAGSLFAQEPPIKPGDPLDLARTLEIGLKMNPSITRSQYAMKARQAQVGQARAGYFPKLDGSAGFTRNVEVKNTRDPNYAALLDRYNRNVASVSLQQMFPAARGQ